MAYGSDGKGSVDEENLFRCVGMGQIDTEEIRGSKDTPEGGRQCRGTPDTEVETGCDGGIGEEKVIKRCLAGPS